MPPTGRQRSPDPESSLFKQNLGTQLRCRKGPAGDPSSYPIPKARGAWPPRPQRRDRLNAHELLVDEPPPPFTALREFTLNGTNHRTQREQGSMIRRHVSRRNRHTACAGIAARTNAA